MKRSAFTPLLLIAFGMVAVILFLRGVGGSGPAETPAVFSSGVTLSEAVATSKSSGKPVFVLATADWCGPCQRYKKTTLSDDAVASAIESAAIPVYLDVDRAGDAAGRLGVQAIPATIILRGDEKIAHAEGILSADAVLEMLEDATR